MKIKKEDYGRLRDAIQSTVEHYGGAQGIRAYRVRVAPESKDPDVRVRWDLLWASTPIINLRPLWEYLDDTHVDTALKNIVKELGI